MGGSGDISQKPHFMAFLLIILDLNNENPKNVVHHHPRKMLSIRHFLGSYNEK